jgi:hypothetical protein
MERLGGYQIDRFAAVLGDLNRFFEGPVMPKPEVLLNVRSRYRRAHTIDSKIRNLRKLRDRQGKFKPKAVNLTPL